MDCLFCKPCGIAVEFDNVVYITDIDTNRVNVITPLINTAEFLKCFYKAFPIHNKGDIYELQTVKDAVNIVNNFENYLSTLTPAADLGFNFRGWAMSRTREYKWGFF